MTRQVLAYIVNAFTGGASGGSPTGVILNSSRLTDAEMQNITRQLPASHTAFVIPPTQHDEPVRLRFFTARGELTNCGHGTIAVHFVLATQDPTRNGKTVTQEVCGKRQRVAIAELHGDIHVYLHQGEITFTEVDAKVVNALLTTLGLQNTDLDSSIPPTLASPGSKRFLLGVKRLESLNNISPDFSTLRQVCDDNGSIGCFVYVIERSVPQAYATARMFAPSIGVQEDIINGNSSGCLCAYILRTRGAASATIVVRQGHAFNREGVVRAEAKRIGNHIEATVGGTARIETTVEITV